ncbi:MAG: PAS domain-containing protein [Deltaproteobacteria bacterium]|nr:PAS domain-containing protein [Deltaproteobacteria bacterium]MBW2571070.1 PAS domain-containing protein [Deltaproteobacteria bacterium]MBW2669107.1 PAS domain-containing protein [Deltaproteobacteria bacterium]
MTKKTKNSPATDLERWVNLQLIETIPLGIAIIDPEYNLVYANKTFEQLFGDWKNRKCYNAYKSENEMCAHCESTLTFTDGTPRVNEEMGYDKNGRHIHYLQHATPIVDEDGNFPYIVHIFTNITEATQIRDEHQILFDQVPCNILLIDRNFRIVKANKRLRDSLGNPEGNFCFETLKGLKHKCSECTARQTFEDGQIHTGYHSWKSKGEQPLHLHVITVPLKRTDGSFDVVLEMAVDVTETMKLQDKLKFAHTYLNTIISTSIDGIFAVNEKGKVTIFNPAARKFFKIKDNQVISRENFTAILPKDFLAKVFEQPGHVYLPEAEVKTIDGEPFPVRLVGNKLMVDDKSIGMAFSVQDLREIKQLEREKIEAERLSAVGHTVAGLAHGIKNLNTALEGGMYMLKSGLAQGNIERIQKGMDMLARNVERVSIFVKAFLSFSKGREIQAKICDPAEIAKEVVDLYAVKAEKLGITLKYEKIGDIAPAPIDFESMHECLTNLVGNAIDACQMSDENSCYVTVRTFEEYNTIIYEVADNGCGMDYEVKRKVFTTFFTTKGLGGSGLGLLMTKKIVHEHGGTIDLKSKSGKGTTFSIRLPRRRLPKIVHNSI